MRQAYNDFINRRFYKFFCLICALILLILCTFLLATFHETKDSYFTCAAYGDYHDRKLMLNDFFINQGLLLSFLYYSFIVVSLLFVVTILLAIIACLFFKKRKILHLVFIIMLILLTLNQIIELISFFALDIPAVYESSLLFFGRILFINPYINFSEILVFTCAFLPVFYSAVSSKNRTINTTLVYIIAFCSSLLLLSLHLGSTINFSFFQEAKYRVFDLTSMIILLLPAVFGLTSLLFFNIKTLKFKVIISFVSTVLIYVPLVILIWFTNDESTLIILMNVYTYFVIIFLPSCPMGVANIIEYIGSK